MGGSRGMRAFTEPLQELEEFQKIQQALQKQSIQVTGCIDAQKAHFIYAAGAAAKKKLIVTYSELRAKELCENYRLFDKNVLFYPAKDLIFYSADVQSNLLVQQRIRVLQKLMEEEEVCPECGHVHEHGEHHHHDHEEHEHHHDHDHECGCGHDHDHEEHEHHHHDHDHECGCGHDHHDHHHHHADEVFTSWGRETIRKFTRENLEKMLEALSASDEYGIILRAKGMLPAEDGTWIYFDMVPEETEIREGAPEYTGRLCVIGSKLKEDKLAELFGL